MPFMTKQKQQKNFIKIAERADVSERALQSHREAKMK